MRLCVWCVLIFSNCLILSGYGAAFGGRTNRAAIAVEEDPAFPFLVGLNATAKQGFLDVIWSPNMAYSEKTEKLDQWADKFNNSVKEMYEEWKTESEDFMDKIVNDHKNATLGLSADAKVADKKFMEIITNQQLTPVQKCQEMVKLSANLSTTVRSEIRMTPPKDIQCDEQTLLPKPKGANDSSTG